MAESPIEDAEPIERSEDVLLISTSDEPIRLSPPIEVTEGGVSGMSHHNPDGRDLRRARRLTVPLADIEEIRVRRTDEMTTSFLVVGAVAGVLFGTFYLMAQEVD